jgi:hypothetical protein
MTSIRFACPGEAARLRDYADQLELIGRHEAAQLWRELADRIEARRYVDMIGAIEEDGGRSSATATGAS